VWLSVTSLSFDISALELLLPLTTGARVQIASRDVVADGRKLADLVARSGASIMQATPAGWTLLLESGWSGHPGLKALCGGEAMTADLAGALKACGVELWNMYGPTETTIWSAAGCIDDSQVITLGEAIHDTQLCLVDDSGLAVPIGGVGELCIGGANLARGYLNRPGLTAERFVPSPFGARGERLYRTGDLCRHRSDGTIEFLGRLDQQIKLRGFRIEPGEIEALLRAQDGVSQAVVVGRKDERGETRLVAYVVIDAATTPTPLLASQLREQLKKHFPDHMVPSAVLVLDALPLTPNGKLDRRALPAPETGVETAAYVEPRTPTEKVLAAIWADVLGVAQVSAQDDFYLLGGHSLLAVRVVSRIGRALGRAISLQTLFMHPVLADLAAAIDRQVLAPFGQAIVRRPAGQDRLPLSPGQERLWFLWCLEPESPAYNISGALRLDGELDTAALRAALQGVVERHESLRVHIEERDGAAWQVVGAKPDFGWATCNLSTLPEPRRPAKLTQQLEEAAAAPFDLRRGKLLRAKLIKLSEREHVLAVAMHHIVSDGWSIAVLLRELAELYAAARNSRAINLPDLPIQYGDYALWQRTSLDNVELAAQLAYWRERLGSTHPVLALPVDRVRRGPRGTAGGRFICDLPVDMAAALGRLSQARRVTLFMTLLAAFDVLLARYSGQRDIRIGVPVVGRRQLETEGLIGFFVNTLVIRAEFDGTMRFGALLAQVRERVLEAQANQDVPFTRLLEILRPERHVSHTPLFQVMFSLDPADDSVPDFPGLRLSRLASETGATQFDLTLTAREMAAGLQLSFGYAHDIFDAATIKRIAAHYVEILHSVCRDGDIRLGEIGFGGPVAAAPMIYPFHPVMERIAAQAAARPDAEAIGCEGSRLRYGELAAWSNRIARRLRRLGVKADERVGLCVERSPGLVAGAAGRCRGGNWPDGESRAAAAGRAGHASSAPAARGRSGRAFAPGGAAARGHAEHADARRLGDRAGAVRRRPAGGVRHHGIGTAG
jgi:non-ribosomal peptide synthetase component F